MAKSDDERHHRCTCSLYQKCKVFLKPRLIQPQKQRTSCQDIDQQSRRRGTHILKPFADKHLAQFCDLKLTIHADSVVWLWFLVSSNVLCGSITDTATHLNSLFPGFHCLKCYGKWLSYKHGGSKIECSIGMQLTSLVFH